nr:hypothetical protein [Arthrobacter sp. Hiyo1]
MTPPSGWLSDPQRPIYLNGKYNLYYLHSNQDNGPGGWRHATSSDTVAFNDQGDALPLQSNFPVWTGSSVIDTNNTAGFGAGAVVALATQPPTATRSSNRNTSGTRPTAGQPSRSTAHRSLPTRTPRTGSATRRSFGTRHTRPG